MARLSFTTTLAALQREVKQQLALVQQQTRQIDEQQSVLDVQFRRMADIQAELDLVKATVRLAAPEHAARLIGLQPAQGRAGLSAALLSFVHPTQKGRAAGI